MINAVIFDFDGVVTDSMPIHFRAYQRVFGPLGVKLEIDELKNMIAAGAPRIIRFIVDKYDIKGKSNEELVDLKTKYALEEKQVPVEGIKELIIRLEKEGVRRGIASSGKRVAVQKGLSDLGMEKKFECVMTLDDTGIPKPDPALYSEAAKCLGVKAEECVAIEDAEEGIWSAKRAGMKVIGFISKNSVNQDLSAADWIVESLDEITIEKLKDI